MRCGDYEVLLNRDGAMLVGYYGNEHNIVVMPNICAQPVIELCGSTFENNTNINYVTIPDTVTSIGKHSFRGCLNLRHIEMTDKVKKIGQGAFHRCKKLNLSLPLYLEEIGIWAFAECAAIKEFVIPKTIVAIGEHAFYNCPNLKLIAPEHLKPNHEIWHIPDEHIEWYK